MVIVALLIFFGIPITLIGIGYYLDYKRDKKYFLSGIKGSFKGIAIFTAFLIVSTLFGWLNDMIFPLYKDYGLSKNKTRIELGIPIIEDDWIEQPTWGNQYRQWYSSTFVDSTFEHEKKKIEFNIWGATNEEDYFGSRHTSIKLVTRYDYQSKIMTYLRIEPIPLNEQKIADDKGRIILNRQTEREVELTKSQFDENLKELKN